MMSYCEFVTFVLSHWYPGSGGVLDCIDSRSLPSFLLFQIMAHCFFKKIFELKFN